MGRTSSCALLVPSLLLICLLIAPLCAQGRIHFYILGTEGCPHCKHLKEALMGAYGPGAVTFLEVRYGENAEKLLSLYKLVYPEVEAVGVPLTVVALDNVPVACAVGDLPLDVWRRLVEEARKTGKFVKMGLDGQTAPLDEGVRQNVAQILGLRPVGAARDPPQRGSELIIALTVTFAILATAGLTAVYLRNRRKRSKVAHAS